MKVIYTVKVFTIQNHKVSGGNTNTSVSKIILPSINWIIKNVKILLADSEQAENFTKNYQGIIDNIQIDAIKKKDYYVLKINQPQEYIEPWNAMYFNDDIHNQNIQYRGNDVNIEIGKNVQNIRKIIKNFYF